MTDSTTALLQEGYALKCRMTQDKARLADIHGELARRAHFAPGSATGHIQAGGLAATVVRRTNITWDQAQLEKLRIRLGDALFFKIFVWEYRPLSARALTVFYRYGTPEDVAAVRAAATEKPGQASVTYETVTPKEASGHATADSTPTCAEAVTTPLAAPSACADRDTEGFGASRLISRTTRKSATRTVYAPGHVSEPTGGHRHVATKA